MLNCRVVTTSANVGLPSAGSAMSDVGRFLDVAFADFHADLDIAFRHRSAAAASTIVPIGSHDKAIRSPVRVVRRDVGDNSRLIARRLCASPAGRRA